MVCVWREIDLSVDRRHWFFAGSASGFLRISLACFDKCKSSREKCAGEFDLEEGREPAGTSSRRRDALFFRQSEDLEECFFRDTACGFVQTGLEVLDDPAE